MNKRTVSAIIFSLAILIELIVFLNKPTPTTFSEREEGSKSLFGKVVTDHSEQSQSNSRFIILIGATAIIGCIITFSLPNKK